MESIPVKKGKWVVWQDMTCSDGWNIVHVYDGSKEDHAHPIFGELALIYSLACAPSIIAQTDGYLWTLHHSFL
eukprot:1012931-Ditylum_brightwellii.AAC.1